MRKREKEKGEKGRRVKRGRREKGGEVGRGKRGGKERREWEREGRERRERGERERERVEGCEPNAWHSKEAAFKGFGWDADLQNLWTHNSLAYKACWRHQCAQKGLAE